jgi:hypothetical protein
MAADGRNAPLIAFNCLCDSLPTLVFANLVGQRIACPHSGARMIVPQGRPFGDDDWRACQLPELLLQYLLRRGRQVSPRKCRLLICATARRHWDRIPDGRSREVVAVAERFADGLADDAERQAAEAEARAVSNAFWATGARTEAGWSELPAAAIQPTVSLGAHLMWLPSLVEPLPRESALFRDVVGDPFRPVRLDPLWLTWNDRTVPQLAHTIYEGRAFERLLVLADALEDAGCDNADLLGHLRGEGEHVRGCWAVDLLLGLS